MMRAAALAGAVVLLSACAHTDAIEDDGLGFAERQARLAAVTDWDLSGDIVIDTGEDAKRASVNWKQRGDRLDLRVRGTLGAGAFRVTRDADRLTIVRRGETRVLDDPETQLRDEYGWWLPVTSLEYWLLGRPDPDPAYRQRSNRGAAGRLTMLEQRDWQIVYEEYQLANGLLIPRSVTMHHATLRLDVDIDRWETAMP
jgi:outer membrane lipoprotein LolB